MPARRCMRQTRALDVDDGKPCSVRTARGTVKAAHVIVATHIPFLDRGLFFARTHPERSYVLGMRVNAGVPRGMYLSTERPAHSIRSHPVGRRRARACRRREPQDRTERLGASVPSQLERYAREHFDVRDVDYRWATQDNMPVDGMPYVGKLWPFSERVLAATGYRKWGLAVGTAAAMMLCDRILGRPNEWAATFDPMRVKPLASAGELVKESANVAFCFFGDRLIGAAVRIRPPVGRRKDRPLRAGPESRLSRRGRVVSTRSRHAALTWAASCAGTRPKKPGIAPVTARASTTTVRSSRDRL